MQIFQVNVDWSWTEEILHILFSDILSFGVLSFHLITLHIMQGRNHGENLGSTSAMVGRICPPLGWDWVKVFENLGTTAVAPVAPVVTSLSVSR